MPRKWTDEQRAEARKRALARGWGKAKVEERPVDPVRSEAVFIAENEGKPSVETVEKSEDEDGNPVTTTHTRPGTLVMYKPLEHGGYEPRPVSRTAIGQLLKNGWAEVCPDCKKRHLDKQGRDSTDPNLCSARPPVKVILCPVCRIRIYDNMPYETGADDPDDENVIDPDDLQESTPEQRLTAARNLHMWMNHPRSSQERGLPPLPDAMRAEVAEARK
jgi:hypothetical protein